MASLTGCGTAGILCALPRAVSSAGRALALHARGRWFEPSTAHHPSPVGAADPHSIRVGAPAETVILQKSLGGLVVQLVRTPACHAGGREFESRRARQLLRACPLMPAHALS